jgi:hypothetical protein
MFARSDIDVGGMETNRIKKTKMGIIMQPIESYEGNWKQTHHQ